MDKIIKNLYLGNIKDGQNCLLEGGYAVLSVGEEFNEFGGEDGVVRIPLRNPTDCDWKNIPMWDKTGDEILNWLEVGMKFISSHIKEKPVIVHCMAGKSRSVSFIWAYLMSCGCEPVYAYRIIKKARPIAEPHFGFLKSILGWFGFDKVQTDDIIENIKEINKNGG